MIQPVQDPAKAENHVLAEEVYDLLMADIEPELLLANIPLLESKYASQTPEQKEARMERYATAYKKFDTELQGFMNNVDGKVRTAQRTALKAREEEVKKQESNTLQSIASSFQ